MSDASGLSYLFSSAAWVSGIPGQFVTGEATSGIVRFWNASSAQPLESLTLNSAGVSAILDLPSNRLFIAFVDGMLSIYDLEFRRWVFQLRAGHTNSIVNLKFLPESDDVFVSAGAEGAVCVWSASEMRQIDRISPVESNQLLLSMDVSPGGGVVACGYANGSIGIFSLDTRSRIFEMPVFESPIISVSFDFGSPSFCMCVGRNQTVALVDIQTRQALGTFASPLGPLRLGRMSYKEGVFAVAGGNRIAACRLEGGLATEINDYPISNLAWSPLVLTLLAYSDSSGFVMTWDYENGESSVLCEHGPLLKALCFHPSLEDILVTGTCEGYLRIHSIKDKSVLASVYAHGSCVDSLVFSPDNPYLLISGSSDSSLKFWSLDKLFTKQTIAAIVADEKAWIRPWQGAKQLLRLARRICRIPGDQLPFDRSDVIHVNDIVKFCTKTVHDWLSGSASEMQLIKRAIRNKERMMQAAKFELFMGNIKHYCELMFAAGEYDLAVAAAPAVSHGFWSEMVKNRAKLLELPKDIAKCMLMSGLIHDALKLLLETGSPDSAFLVAAAQRMGYFGKNQVKAVQQERKPIDRPYRDDQFLSAQSYTEYTVASERARWHLSAGEVYMAAASYMSIGDVISAELLLLRHRQVIPGYMIDKMMNVRNPQVRNRFAILAIRNRLHDEVFGTLGDDEKEKMAIVINFTDRSARLSFYQKHNMRAPEEYERVGDAVAPLQKLQGLFLAGKRDEAVHFYLEFAKQNLGTDFVAVREMTQLVEIGNIESIDTKTLSQVVSVSLYFAVYAAMWKGYVKIGDQLQKRICSVAAGIQWFGPFLAEATKAFSIFGDPRNGAKILEPGHKLLNLKKLGSPYDPERKYGHSYTLDDGMTTMPIESALMWFECTPFSPVTLNVRHYLS
jgi:WD40 repeat protein